ncbi:hypothetical protein ACROYT_G007835 [Oculina patagonica]
MNIVAILLLSALTYSAANDNQPTTATSWSTTAAPTAASCGSKPAGTRIVGGNQAQNGSWPWQAMLAYAGGSQFCGGSLIDQQWVVTAAHCVHDTSASEIVVRMGAYKITDIAQELRVVQIIINDEYDPDTYTHDIALLRLETRAILGEGVGLVCLPDENFALVTGKECFITGWGTLSSGGSQPDYLQEASVAKVSKKKCKKAYGWSNIDYSMICAGFDAGGVDACQGDSGGPMVCEFNDKWYLEGVTSWGNGCAAAGKYGVYAKVRFLKSWVEEFI